MKFWKSARAAKWLALVALMVLTALALVGCDKPTQADDGYILVFDYGGKFIPVEQLHEAPNDNCDSYHYHASGPVVTLRGESLTDPDPTNCGFGKSGELRYEQVPMPDDYLGPQREPDWEWEEANR